MKQEEGKMGKAYLRLVCWSSFLFFFSSAVLMAQVASTGAIVGTVSDPTGSVVEDAEVSVTNSATGVKQMVRTNSSGFFDAEALVAAGTTYDVTIRKPGFKTFESKGLVLHPGERASVNVSLEL